MKLLLTSSGIANDSIKKALVDLLGKPIEESNALFVPTAIYPFVGGPVYAWRAIAGQTKTPFCQLGWKTLGVLELTALPSIERKTWLSALQGADALLVWGGDPLYLSYWMQLSGLTDLLPSFLDKLVYVGVSAGSMATSTVFGETYSDPPAGANNALTKGTIVFDTPQGPISRIFITAKGAALVGFALIPHFQNKDFPDADTLNAKKWAAQLPSPVYAIDDQTAIKVKGDLIEVISEGKWTLFLPEK